MLYFWKLEMLLKSNVPDVLLKSGAGQQGMNDRISG